MLNFLQIRNYAIVDSLDLEFPAGFTCISGETGAGKSILVGVLGLLCGNRADTSAIRDGAARAELNAGFDLPESSPAFDWLREAELDDDRQCLLRRTISANGRSRGWINGTAVTLQQLADLGELLVEIHGQNEHIRLVRRSEQFRLLDGGGFHDPELKRLKKRFECWQALDQERQLLLGETPLDAAELDLLQYQIHELESALLPADQFRALEQEHRKLSRGTEIVESLEYAIRLLDDDQSIGQAAAALNAQAELDEDISTALDLIKEAGINCDEARRSLQTARSRLDLSPERLIDLERQLNQQHDLARKHHVEPEQLAETLQQLQARHERAGTQERRLNEIEQDLERALADYRQAAEQLSLKRCSRAGELAGAVTDLMQELGMAGGRFELIVSHDPESRPSARGGDSLELMVSANPGSPPGPLRKVASGGELSRISLAIKVAARTGASATTQVFDEVDAGIGGETAHAVGALLKSLSADGQALCVTHLAQVAVFADQQIQVRKSSDDLETRVKTRLLAKQDRVDEIARMLGGKISDQSRAHASELLDTASTRH